jgi:hypothetical protein
VWAAWQGGDPSYSIEDATDSNGVATLLDVIPGAIWVYATKDGYADVNVGPLQFKGEEGEGVSLTMVRAGKVRGVVRHLGEPVESFEVVHWSGEPVNASWEEFEASADGSFELNAVPLGRLWLYASSPDYPRSDTQAIEVVADGTAEVVIDLPDPIVGEGQVVDGDTGDPLLDATLQLYTNHGHQLITPWGAPVAVDSEGRFRVRGFPPGHARMLVSAPGYATQHASAWGHAGETIDLGRIALFRGKSLHVRLVSSSVTDFTGYSVYVNGTNTVPSTPFATDGTVELTGLASGGQDVRVDGPDGLVFGERVELFDGEDWTLDIPLERGPPLLVTLVGGAHPVPDGGMIRLKARHPEGGFVVMGRSFTAGEPTHFASAPGTTVTVGATSGGRELLQTVVRLDPDRPNELELALDATESTYRVVDAAGDPLAGVDVYCGCVDDAQPWFGRERTGTDGLVTLVTPCDELVFHLIDPALGARMGVRVPRARPGETLDVELDAPYALRIRLVDGQAPVSGTRILLEHAATGQNVGISAPDSRGIIRWDRLGAGRYRATLAAPGYWSASSEVDVVGRLDPIRDVQFRRLGDLRVEARDTSGQPVAGARLDATLAGFGSLAEWRASGRIDATLTTDADGVVEVHGIPNGDYAWTLTTPDGATRTGEVNVPRDAKAEIVVRGL